MEQVFNPQASNSTFPAAVLRNTTYQKKNMHMSSAVNGYSKLGSLPFVAAVLKGTTYQNNSIVTLEDIGEGGDDALLCITNLTACCRPPYTDEMGTALGNWFFPNGTRVPSSGFQWDIHRTRGHMKVLLHRRRGGEEGIYCCVIPDSINVNQTIYIGVYSESTGE